MAASSPLKNGQFVHKVCHRLLASSAFAKQQHCFFNGLLGRLVRPLRRIASRMERGRFVFHGHRGHVVIGGAVIGRDGGTRFLSATPEEVSQRTGQQRRQEYQVAEQGCEKRSVSIRVPKRWVGVKVLNAKAARPSPATSVVWLIAVAHLS